MRHFTKLGMVITVAVLYVFPLKSQDAGVTSISVPDPGVMQYPNIKFSPAFVLHNFGSTALTTSQFDSLVVECFANTKRILHTYVNSSVFPIAAGADVSLVYGGTVSFKNAGLGSAQTNFSYCVKSLIRQNNTTIDQNTSNDETCIVMLYSGDSNPFSFDLKLSNIQISAAPIIAYIPGSYLPSSASLASISYDLTNNGATDVPMGLSYAYKVWIDATSKVTVPAATFAPLSSMGTGTESHTYNVGAAGPYLPTKGGPFQLCAELIADSVPTDTDHSNDKTCSDYNSLVGIDITAPVNNNYFKMTYINKTLRIDLNKSVSGISDISVYSISGQKVYQESYEIEEHSGHQINLTNLEDGVYIAKARTESGIIETYRFIVR